MARIKISADSTCDLTEEIIEKLNLNIIPLTVVSGGNMYKDRVDITSADVIRLTEETGSMCSTSAVNIVEFEEKFEELLKDNDEVIHISISSGLSVCFDNACKAAEKFNGRVRVIDSKNLSTGISHIIFKAAEMAENGENSADIEKTLNEMVGRVEASFVVDSMDYLKRGGRCSALQAFGASLLKIKPSINVIDGKMTVGDTYKGSFERCLRRYVKERLEDRDDIDYDRIFVTYSSAPDGIPEMVEELIKEYGDFKEIIRTTAGSTITCHCGPNTLGILFVRNK